MVLIEETTYGLKVNFSENLDSEDFKQFETALLTRIHTIHRPDILLDLTYLHDFTLDAAWEVVHFIRAHAHDFGRVAVAVNDIWIKMGVQIAKVITAQRPKFFRHADAAQAWLMSDD
jgi:hypothetical protein